MFERRGGRGRRGRGRDVIVPSFVISTPKYSESISLFEMRKEVIASVCVGICSDLENGSEGISETYFSCPRKRSHRMWMGGESAILGNFAKLRIVFW